MLRLKLCVILFITGTIFFVVFGIKVLSYLNASPIYSNIQTTCYTAAAKKSQAFEMLNSMLSSSRLPRLGISSLFHSSFLQIPKATKSNVSANLAMLFTVMSACTTSSSAAYRLPAMIFGFFIFSSNYARAALEMEDQEKKSDLPVLDKMDIDDVLEVPPIPEHTDGRNTPKDPPKPHFSGNPVNHDKQINELASFRNFFAEQNCLISVETDSRRNTLTVLVDVPLSNPDEKFWYIKLLELAEFKVQTSFTQPDHIRIKVNNIDPKNKEKLLSPNFRERIEHWRLVQEMQITHQLLAAFNEYVSIFPQDLEIYHNNQVFKEFISYMQLRDSLNAFFGDDNQRTLFLNHYNKAPELLEAGQAAINKLDLTVCQDRIDYLKKTEKTLSDKDLSLEHYNAILHTLITLNNELCKWETTFKSILKDVLQYRQKYLAEIVPLGKSMASRFNSLYHTQIVQLESWRKLFKAIRVKTNQNLMINEKPISEHLLKLNKQSDEERKTSLEQFKLEVTLIVKKYLSFYEKVKLELKKLTPISKLTENDQILIRDFWHEQIPRFDELVAKRKTIPSISSNVFLRDKITNVLAILNSPDNDNVTPLLEKSSLMISGILKLQIKDQFSLIHFLLEWLNAEFRIKES